MPFFIVTDVQQRLSNNQVGELEAKNNARVEIFGIAFLFEARGPWRQPAGSPVARVSFSEFRVRAPPLPALCLPVPLVLRTEAEFQTLFIDKELRICRGVRSGNSFAFVRSTRLQQAEMW
jgi:hypothetical protein